MKKKCMVIKFGGSLGVKTKASEAFFKGLAALARRQPLVVVHGGGPEVNAWLERAGVKSRFINGLRYTDESALEIVEMVLSGKVNKTIVAELIKHRIRAVGISGKDGMSVISKRVKSLGLVGEPMKTDPRLVSSLLAQGFVPVMSSLSIDTKGQTLNVNADTMAMAIAGGLKSQQLILLTNVPGVLDSEKKVIPVIRVKEIPALIKCGVITGGMIPKIKACAKAINSGVAEVLIADGRNGIGRLSGTVIKG